MTPVRDASPMLHPLKHRLRGAPRKFQSRPSRGPSGVPCHQQVKLRWQWREVDLYVEARWFAAVEGGLQSGAQLLDASHVFGMASERSCDVVVTGIGKARTGDVSGA